MSEMAAVTNTQIETPVFQRIHRLTGAATRSRFSHRLVTTRSNCDTTDGMENVTIPIFHGASISGRVLDANGDPLDYAQVNVLRIPTAGRLGRPSQRGSGSTDDRGEFRVGRLEAGTYIVQVTPRRQPSPGEMVMTPGANPTPPSAEPLPTYYPGSLAIEQAQPITLDKGQAVADIDVVLSEGIPGVVNGVVTVASGAPPGESNSYVNVRRIMLRHHRQGMEVDALKWQVFPGGVMSVSLPTLKEAPLSGLEVTSVKTIGERYGMHANDIIVAVDGVRVNDLDQYYAAKTMWDRSPLLSQY